MNEAEFFVVLTVLIGGFLLLWPVARALGERIRARPGTVEPAVRDEMQRFREDIGEEVQQLRREVAELGERVDFAERLLAKQQQALPRHGA